MDYVHGYSVREGSRLDGTFCYTFFKASAFRDAAPASASMSR